jgi:hypothetical protein
MQENRKRKVNWGSAIGWLIFILVIAGGPLLNLLRSLLQGVVTLPSNLLPILIGGLVALSILVSVVRAIGTTSRAQSDTRLPTSTGSARTPNAPMPPFAGPARPPQLPGGPPRSPRSFTPPTAGTPRLPSAPRFEPIVNSTVLVLGLLGLLVLAGAALLIFGFSLP